MTFHIEPSIIGIGRVTRDQRISQTTMLAEQFRVSTHMHGASPLLIFIIPLTRSIINSGFLKDFIRYQYYIPKSFA